MSKTLIFTVLFFSFIILPARAEFTNFQTSVEHGVHNLDSGMNFTTIQQALDDSTTVDGNTILVDAGIYYEHLSINKSVIIIGESRNTVLVDGNRSGTVISISSNNTVLHGLTVRNSGTRFPDSGICLNGSFNSSIINVRVTDSFYGVFLNESSCCRVFNNVIRDSTTGICLENSGNCSIRENAPIENNWNGIRLRLSPNCVVNGNNVNNSGQDGIILVHSSNCSIVCNTVSNSVNRGVVLSYSLETKVYHNNLHNNTIQAGIYPAEYVACWDNGVEGNHWSQPEIYDLNHDGISDAPYIINNGNTDNYPLEGWFTKLRVDSNIINIITNSSIVDYVFNRTALTIELLDSAFEADGFCRICVPHNVLHPPYSVVINRGEIHTQHFNNSIYGNNTHTWIYFAYVHEADEIVVIPDFSVFKTLTLLLILTLANSLFKLSRPRSLEGG